MDTIALDPGSFRDPDGGVFFWGERVYRYFNPSGAEKFLALTASGLLDALGAQGRVIAWRRVPLEEVPGLQQLVPQARLVLEHPRVPFLSYCYEWSFEMLKVAAICTLEVSRAAMEKGYILKDATPYNVQFVGSRPVFIDLASFEPYEEGQPWEAYTQFCRLFLNPLLLQAFTGVPFQPWLRGSLEGIEPADLARTLSWRRKLLPPALTHVLLQAWLNRHVALAGPADRAMARPKVARRSVTRLMSRLQRSIERLKSGRPTSRWVRYEEEHGYHPEAQQSKEAFIQRVLATQRPRVLWDLGCNTGRYSMIAAPHSEYVIAMDNDADAVDLLYQKARGHFTNILPLVVDLLNPSPDLGWAQAERRGLLGRGPADMVLCLALVHHLAMRGNLPFSNLVDWLGRVARGGIIEFVPKQDPRVRELLRWRQDVYPWYSQEAFETALAERFTVAERCPLPHSGRVLYHVRAHGR